MNFLDDLDLDLDREIIFDSFHILFIIYLLNSFYHLILISCI